MKSLIALIAITGIYNMSFASNYVFKSNSPVPVELQDKILAVAQAQCPKLNVNNLAEVETSTRVDIIDQGVRDYYYSTVLSYSFYFDGAHPITYRIGVESSNIDVNNPPDARYNVGLFDGLDSELCE